jgi:hypothetical protein
LAVGKPQHVERGSGYRDEHMRRHHIVHRLRRFRLAAQDPPVRRKNADLLHGRGAPGAAAQGLHQSGRARALIAAGNLIGNRQRCADARLRKRKRAAGGGGNFPLRLPFDLEAEPDIEGEHGRAAEQHPGDDRDQMAARQSAREMSHLGLQHIPPRGPKRYGHRRRKGRLNPAERRRARVPSRSEPAPHGERTVKERAGYAISSAMTP